MGKKQEEVRQVNIVVDTNIVFSALLNSSGTIGTLLLGSSPHVQFYTCEYLRTEIFKHREKIKKITKATDEELSDMEVIIMKKITFINEALIPEKTMLKAIDLVEDIDANDVAFVALAKHLNAKLWTGDKKLIEGLKDKKYRNVITTASLLIKINELDGQ